VGTEEILYGPAKTNRQKSINFVKLKHFRLWRLKDNQETFVCVSCAYAGCYQNETDDKSKVINLFGLTYIIWHYLR